MKNPNCDNRRCCSTKGEVRVLPIGGDSNAILCANCYYYEMGFRRERNKALGTANQFKLPKWDDLEIYEGAA